MDGEDYVVLRGLESATFRNDGWFERGELRWRGVLIPFVDTGTNALVYFAPTFEFEQRYDGVVAQVFRPVPPQYLPHILR